MLWIGVTSRPASELAPEYDDGFNVMVLCFYVQFTKLLIPPSSTALDDPYTTFFRK